MNRLNFTVMGSQFFCMWMSVVCTKIQQYLFLSVLLIVSLWMSCLDTGSGMHLVICPTRPALDCCAWAPVNWYVLKPQLRVVSVRKEKGSHPLPPASKFLRWSQQAKLCCFGFCRTVRVHSHWTCRPSLRHPRASHPTPPQLPHRSLLLLPPPSWAMPAPWSTASPPPASEDHRPESAQLVSGLKYPSHTHHRKG